METLEKSSYSLKRWLSKWIQNFFYPHNCIYCNTLLYDCSNTNSTNQSYQHLCGHCFSHIHFIEKPYCYKSGIPLPYDYGKNIVFGEALMNKKTYYDHVRACVVFNDFSRKLVHQFKYADATYLAHFFAQRMYVAGQHFFNGQTDLIIPVPLSYKRLIKRRYNQSAILCNILSQYTQIPCDNLTFYRKHNTKSQTGLTLEQRMKNVHNAFDVITANRNIIKNKHILLVDDILTTGATVSECARILKKHGALSVNILAFARVLID